MKLSITSTVDTNVGIPVTGMIGNIVAHTDSLLTTGQIPCDIEFYANDDAKTKQKHKLFPVVLAGDDTIQELVASCTIDLTESEVNAANLPTTIYNKVAAKLATDYGWTVVAV